MWPDSGSHSSDLCRIRKPRTPGTTESGPVAFDDAGCTDYRPNLNANSGQIGGEHTLRLRGQLLRPPPNLTFCGDWPHARTQTVPRPPPLAGVAKHGWFRSQTLLQLGGNREGTLGSKTHLWGQGVAGSETDFIAFRNSESLTVMQIFPRMDLRVQRPVSSPHAGGTGGSSPNVAEIVVWPPHEPQSCCMGYQHRMTTCDS